MDEFWVAAEVYRVSGLDDVAGSWVEANDIISLFEALGALGSLWRDAEDEDGVGRVVSQPRRLLEVGVVAVGCGREARGSIIVILEGSTFSQKASRFGSEESAQPSESVL